MPKNRSAARREQARRLAAELGVSYTAALRHLDENQAASATSTPDTAAPVVRKSKKAIRAEAAAAGRTYLDVATSLTVSGDHQRVLAEPVRRGLAVALEAAGWPVDVEHNPLAAALRTYAGPGDHRCGSRGRPGRRVDW